MKKAVILLLGCFGLAFGQAHLGGGGGISRSYFTKSGAVLSLVSSTDTLQNTSGGWRLSDSTLALGAGFASKIAAAGTGDIQITGDVGFGTDPDAGYEVHVLATGTNNADFKLESGGGTESIFAQANGGSLTISSDGSVVVKTNATSVSLQAGGANTSLVADRNVGRARVTVGTTGGTGAGKLYAGDSTYTINHFVGSGANQWRLVLGTDNRLEFYFNGTIRGAVDTAGAYNDLYP